MICNIKKGGIFSKETLIINKDFNICFKKNKSEKRFYIQINNNNPCFIVNYDNGNKSSFKLISVQNNEEILEFKYNKLIKTFQDIDISILNTEEELFKHILKHRMIRLSNKYFPNIEIYKDKNTNNTLIYKSEILVCKVFSNYIELDDNMLNSNEILLLIIISYFINIDLSWTR